MHISEVASGWIKDIRGHVKNGAEGDMQGSGCESKRGHIDLSIKDVNERQQGEKLQQWKSEMRAILFSALWDQELPWFQKIYF